MRTIICPIDKKPCEGANGIINSSECRHKCNNGYKFVVAILGKKNLGMLEERHGVYGWAKYHKCKCEPCMKSIRDYRNDVRRKKGVPEFKPAQHGGRQMYERKKCRCEICLDWNLKRNAKERERYARKKAEQASVGA